MVITGSESMQSALLPAESNADGVGWTDVGLRLHPIIGKLAHAVVLAVPNGTIGRTIGRIPKVTTTALLSGSAASPSGPVSGLSPAVPGRIVDGGRVGRHTVLRRVAGRRVRSGRSQSRRSEPSAASAGAAASLRRSE